MVSCIIYKNPTRRAWIRVNWANSFVIFIEIDAYDVMGRLMSSEILPINEGDNKLQWYINATEKGVFFVKIYDGETLTLNKLYIKK